MGWSSYPKTPKPQNPMSIVWFQIISTAFGVYLQKVSISFSKNQIKMSEGYSRYSSNLKVTNFTFQNSAQPAEENLNTDTSHQTARHVRQKKQRSKHLKSLSIDSKQAAAPSKMFGLESSQRIQNQNSSDYQSLAKTSSKILPTDAIGGSCIDKMQDLQSMNRALLRHKISSHIRAQSYSAFALDSGKSIRLPIKPAVAAIFGDQEIFDRQINGQRTASFEKYNFTSPDHERESQRYQGLLLTENDYLQQEAALCLPENETHNAKFFSKNLSKNYRSVTQLNQLNNRMSEVDVQKARIDKSFDSHRVMSRKLNNFSASSKFVQNLQDYPREQPLTSRADLSKGLSFEASIADKSTLHTKVDNILSERVRDIHSHLPPMHVKSKQLFQEMTAHHKSQSLHHEKSVASISRVKHVINTTFTSAKRSLQNSKRLSPSESSLATAMKEFNQQSRQLQSKDLFEKEQSVGISLTRKDTSQPTIKGSFIDDKMSLELSKSVYKLIMNSPQRPKIKIRNNLPKIKPKLRDSINKSVLNMKSIYCEIAKKEKLERNQKDFIKNYREIFKDVQHIAIESEDEVEEVQLDISNLIKTAKQDNTEEQKVISKSKQSERVMKSLALTNSNSVKAFNKVMQEDCAEIFSESDASDYRHDEIEVGMHNSIQNRLHFGLKKEITQKPAPFQHKKTLKLSPIKRQQTIAQTFIDDFDDKEPSSIMMKSIQQLKLLRKQQSPDKQKAGIVMLAQKTQKQLQNMIKFKVDKSFTDDGSENLDRGPQTISIQMTSLDDKISPNKKSNMSSMKSLIMTSQMSVDDESNYADLADQDNFNQKQLDKKVRASKLKRAQEIIEEMNRYEISQHKNRESFCDIMKDDPNLAYIQAVDRDQQVCLPLLRKIQDGKLVLKDYTLDSGHLNGLAEAIKKVTLKLDTVYLDNCGIDDEELAILLSGFLSSEKLSIFAYKNNVFKELGLAEIKPVLLRPSPRNLIELRLFNCVTTPQIMVDLLQFMIKGKVQLRSLYLVKMQIENQGMAKVAQLIDESEYLEDLDVSWNNSLPQFFIPILAALSRNKSLRTLNLSNNNLLDKADFNNLHDEQFKTALDKYLQRIQEDPSSCDLSVQQMSEELPMQVIHSFSRLIRYNKQFQSLILNSCGLNAQVLVGLLPALRHAKSLLCLHMGSNPGISPDVVNLYMQNLNILPEYEQIHIQIELEQLESMSPEQLSELSPRSLQKRDLKLQHQKDGKVENVRNYQNNRRMKQLVTKADTSLNTDGKDLSIMRVLGHKERMPGMGRWQIKTVKEEGSCIVCDNWTYTLYFWNEKIGMYNDQNFIGVTDDTKTQLLNMIKQMCADTYQEDDQVPVLFSSMNKWQPKPFMTMLQFLDTLEPAREPDFTTLAKNKVHAQQNSDETPKNAMAKQLDKQMTAILEAKMIEEMRKEYYEIRYSTAAKIIEDHLNYQKSTLINYDKFSASTKDVYVLPVYLPPGKNDFMIRSARKNHVNVGFLNQFDSRQNQIENQSAFKWYYRRFQSDVRIDRLPPFAKVLKSKTSEQTSFVRELSIFKDWIPDSQQTLDKCFENDRRFWKVMKISQSFEAYEQVCQYFRNRYQEIKEIFFSATIASGDPPNLSSTSFFNFCKTAGIVDKKMNRAVLDNYFAATNYEVTEQDNNDDNQIIRFEFFEILVRIAKGKYMTGETQLDYAMMKLFQTNIMPMKAKLPSLQKWREEELWCLEVNDVLKQNEKAMIKLYKTIAGTPFAKVKNKLDDHDKNRASFDQIKTVLLPVCLKNNLSDLKVTQAFYMSKMTCIDENSNGNYEYTYLHLSEFPEFIGRLSWLKYRDTYEHAQWRLVQKIKNILALLLAIVGERVRTVVQQVEIISDSDDDY